MNELKKVQGWCKEKKKKKPLKILKSHQRYRAHDGMV